MLAVVLVGSYLLGSIPFGYLAGKIAGIDIRRVGSGNVGATNVVRVLGKRYGYPVFALDFLKGFGAVKIAMLIALGSPPQYNSPAIFGIVGAISSVCGHSLSPWLGFNGGKGVATSAGAFFALMPLASFVSGAIWIIVFWLTRYVSVASITTAVVLPIIILVISWYKPSTEMAIFYGSLCVGAVVIWRHRSNVSRLMRGTEPRFTRK